MRLCRRILLLMMAVLFVVPAWAEDGNLLVNGGFDDLDGDGLPSGWYTDAWYFTDGVTEYSVTDLGREGNAAVVENLGGNDARFAQNVEVEPDALYRLSGYIRADAIVDSGRGANISVGDVYSFSESVFDSQGEWVFVELYGRTGPEQTELTVFARVGGYSGLSVGRASFDDLRLERVTTAPAGRIVDPWYNEPVAPVIVDPAPEVVTPEISAPFWPWLLVLAGVFAMAVFMVGRCIGPADPRDLTGEKSRGSGALLLPLLLLAAAVRIFVALNVTGYAVDVGCFVSWGDTVHTAGLSSFYQSAGFCDYPPGYLYVLGFNDWLVEGLLGVDSPFLLTNAYYAISTAQTDAPSLSTVEWYLEQYVAQPCNPLLSLFISGDDAMSVLTGVVQAITFIHKLIPIACDILAAALVYRVARGSGCDGRRAAMGALLLALSPALIVNSAAWYQVDSVLCLLLLVVAWMAMRGRWDVVLPVYVVSILVKPQALMLGFLGLAAIIVSLLRELPRRVKKRGKRVLEFRTAWKRMGWGLVWSVLAATAIILPAALGQDGLGWLFELYGSTLSSYPYATVNTANLYYLFGGNWSSIVMNANRGVTAILMLLSAGWCVVTFMRRRDRRLTVMEPAMVAMLTLGAALTALGVIPMLSGAGEDYILSIGNPWYVMYGESGYVRTYIPGAEGAWALPIAPALLLVLGLLLLAGAAVILCVKLMCGSREDKKRFHTGLIEPTLMLLFTAVFAFMLVLDTTWSALGTVAMALAFAVVLPMFVRGGRMHTLPLCGAVLFILLYVLGVKMHERYLFPALFLLGMACAASRDRRLVWLLGGLSCTLFINEGVILDNSIRLGSAMGHLNQDTQLLASVLSVANVGMAIWSVWLCQRICVEDAPAAPRRDGPVLPVDTLEEPPCTALNYQDSSRVRWGWLDAALIGVVTLIYAVVTFTTLGSTKAPQNAYTMTDERSQVVIDLGAYHDDFTFLYNCQVSYRDFTVETSDDGVTWSPARQWWAQMAEGECFRWKYLTPYYINGTKRTYYGADDVSGVVHLYGRYVRITAQRQHRYDADYYPAELQAQEPLVINEIIFRNAAGEAIPAKIVGVYEPDGTALMSYSMRWRIEDAREMLMDAGAALMEEEASLFEMAAAQGMSAANASMVGEKAADVPEMIMPEGVESVLGMIIPPWTEEASALLDEQDTLDGEPGWWNSTYFDEIYHARTAFEHATGQDAYEWTHPPLGKVIMSWFVDLFGMTPFGWRFGGALCGVMMLPAMYALAKQLTKRRLMAFAAMLLMAVDCMHLTQTRIATIDSYPVLFIILSYFFMLRFIQRDIVVTPMKKLLPDLALSGLFMGCGIASKWIGIYAGAGLAVLYFWACLRALRVGILAARAKRSGLDCTNAEMELLGRRDRPAMARIVYLCLWCLLFFVVVPVAIYLGSYIVHYQAREVDGIGGWLQLVWQTQINMLNYHGTPGLGMDHPYYSPWYEWMTMQTPMYYASPSFVPDGWRYAIYCFGNPLVWYMGLVGVVYAAYCWMNQHRYAIRERSGVWHLFARTWDVGPAFILIGLAAQILPWILVPRGTYIYHYFASVPFLILGAVLMLDRLMRKKPTLGLVVTLAYLALSVALFVFLFPYASGVTTPEWWMDLIRNYPWIGASSNPAINALCKLMEAVPLVPNVW